MRLQLVVPMAGDGRRFVEAGYALPKPLIPVAGLPMIVRAVGDLPPVDRTVFLVRAEHIRDHQIDRVLKQYIPDCRIVPVDGLTEGQACTVRLAADELEPDWPVIVAACDNTHLFEQEKLLTQMADPTVAGLIWTYRGEPRVLVNPRQYGWVRVDGSRVVEVSCKAPISEQPIGDYVASGWFSFRSASIMVRAIDRMIAQNVRIKNEFYMDVVPNMLIAQGERVDVFEVDKYIGWGTPADLEDFCKWERFCAKLYRS